MKLKIQPTCSNYENNAKSTELIQNAIDNCHEMGGGTVYFEAGIFMTGTLYLKSNVHLEISEAAILLASPDISDYGCNTHYNRYKNEPDLDRCLIYSEDAENIGIHGYGIINGNAEFFPNENTIFRPMMLRFLRCKNIRISDIRLYDSAAWTTAFLDSTFIWINNADIRNEKQYNGDGLDFDGCSHVFVSNSYIKGTDDNLCLQAGSKDYPVEHVHIVNCEFSSLCAGIRIGLKSIGNIQGVVIQNCTMCDIKREGIKIECSEGGNISDIFINNIYMKNVRRPIFAILNNRYEPDGLGNSLDLSEPPSIGNLERITISDMTAIDDLEMEDTHRRFGNDVMGSPSFNGIRIDAAATHPIHDIVLRNIRYTAVGGVSTGDIPPKYPDVVDIKINNSTFKSENYFPDYSRTAFMDLRNIRNLTLEQIHFNNLSPDERPPFILEGCTVLKQEISVDYPAME